MYPHYKNTLPPSILKVFSFMLVASSLSLSTNAQESPEPLVFNVEGGFHFSDNIGLAPLSKDKVDDYIGQSKGSVSYTLFQDNYQDLLINSWVGYQHFFKLNDLSRIEGGISARYRGQLDPALTSPWLEIKTNLTGMNHHDSEIRDGFTVDLTVAIGKRLNEKIGGRIGYRYHHRRSTASRSDFNITEAAGKKFAPHKVFDLDRQGAFAYFEFIPSSDTTFFGEYSFFTGDVNATARGGFNNGAKFTQAWDPAFGTKFKVWRVDADVHTGELGIKHKLNSKTHVKLLAEYMKAFGEANNDYESTSVNLNFNHQF